MTEGLLTPPATILAEGPYKGLRPYEEQDQHAFFGREADCNVLIDKILANKLTLLFAATGVGKSSLLQAAILPRLKDPTREHLDVVYCRDWLDDPLSACKRTALRVLQERGRLDATLRLEDIDGTTLRDFVQFCTLFTRLPLVLILDQFEEFFQYQRSRGTLQAFLQQLAEVITDRSTAVAVVIAMREDFALELNALRPYLPTLLFENFYRLEKLDRTSAQDAIVQPVAPRGFQYEAALVEALLDDLVRREQASRATTPVADLIDTVEPPYLQITCSELWKLEQHNPDKTLHLETYRQHGRAQGLIKTYIENVLRDFSAAEKRLASLAFNHLITRRGTKMAYTAADLASLLREETPAMGKVLDRLATARILRSQARQQVLWYELYHDLFSDIIETWNDRYKSQQRTRRAFILAGCVLAVLAGLYATYDAAVNLSSHHLRLSVREVSDTLELYRGKAGSRDLFGLQHYIAETGYHRAQAEPDKLFVQKPVEVFERLNTELIGLLPLEERIVAYWHSGQHTAAIELARKAISDDNVPRAEAVIKRLEGLGSVHVLQLLQERFRHLRTAFLKARIATAVGTLRIPQSVVMLDEALQAPEAEIRRSVVQALGQLGSAQAVGPLLERLSDPDVNVRQRVAQALGQLGSAQAVGSLLERLSDPDVNVRQRVAQALGQLGSAQAVGSLLERLSDPDTSVRRSVVEALGQLGSAQAVGPLLERLSDPDTSVRWSVVEALGQLGSAQAVGSLLERLSDPDVNVRRSVVEVLGQLGSAQAVGPLLERLSDPDTSVRWSVAQALGQLGSAQAVGPLLERLSDPDTSLRQRVAQALGRLGSPQAITPLLKRMKDPDHKVRRTVLLTLGKLDITSARDAAATVFADTMAPRSVKPLAAALLLRFEHQESLSFLRDLVDSKVVAKRLQAAEALGAFPSAPGIELLMPLLQDDNMQVKIQAITSLGRSKATAAIPFLSPLVTDAAAGTNVRMQQAAVEALGQMDTDDSLGVLRLAVDNPELAIPARRVALAALGNSQAASAAESLLKAAVSEETWMRLDAYTLLGTRRARQALPLLRQHLTQLQAQYDRWRNIRNEARENFTEAEAEKWKHKVTVARPATYWFFVLAHAMARIDPEDTGVALLGHDVADVRAGAWLGIGDVGTVPLVQRLHDLRTQHSKEPLLHQALYRAIDHSLRRLEAFGSQEDLVALRDFLPQVQAYKEVFTRVEWTILQLERLYSDASSRPTAH